MCASTDPCYDSTSCGDCTGRLECGWCASSGRCLVGGGSGPDTGTCADWDYVASSCSACNELMGSCTTAADCCGSLDCRMGVSFGVRCCAGAGTSCTTGADCCGYMDCRSGMCECRTAGRGCLGNGDCCSGTCSGGVCT
jgi:hypothetical protein